MRNAYNIIKLFVGLITIIIIFFIVFFLYLNPLFNNTIDDLIKSRTKSAVEIGYTVLLNYHNEFKSGRLSEEQAKQLAFESLRNLKYYGDGYFWVNDYNHNMLMHPNSAVFEGKNVRDYKDPDGVLLFQEFVKTAKSKNEGFVFYSWHKPNGNKPLPKVSYVKGFKEWNMIIGSGAYVDDINLVKNRIFWGMLFAFIFLIICILLVMLYISNRKHVEKILREKEAKFRDLANLLPQVVFEMDKNGQLTFVNQSAFKMFGYSVDDFNNGINAIEMIAPEDRKNASQNIQKMFIEKQSLGREYCGLRKNGERFPIVIYSSCIYKNSEIIGLRGIIIDITKQKQTEKEIRDLNENLELIVLQRTAELNEALKQIEYSNLELNELNLSITEEALKLSKLNDKLYDSEQELKNAISVKDRFFSIISHDLRGPFSGFLGLTDLLESNASDFSAEDIKRMASSMNKSANALFKMIEDLFLWSKSQTGAIEFHTESLDLGLLLNHTINSLKDAANLKNIKLKSEIDFNTMVHCDKNMINTILRNLISNAIKFTKKDGNISVGIIHNDNDSSNQFSKIFVKDDGVGISDTIKEKMFKVSEKITSRGTANETGSGLGLILCKEFVEKHNGKIWVESEVGKGSTFWFSLPNNN